MHNKENDKKRPLDAEKLPEGFDAGVVGGSAINACNFNTAFNGSNFNTAFNGSNFNAAYFINTPQTFPDAE